jgi:hypothetical protein
MDDLEVKDQAVPVAASLGSIGDTALRFVEAGIRRGFEIGSMRAHQRARDRFELIKAALQGCLASGVYNGIEDEIMSLAVDSVRYADAVLALLDTEAKRESEGKP